MRSNSRYKAASEVYPETTVSCLCVSFPRLHPFRTSPRYIFPSGNWSPVWIVNENCNSSEYLRVKSQKSSTYRVSIPSCDIFKCYKGTNYRQSQHDGVEYTSKHVVNVDTADVSRRRCTPMIRTNEILVSNFFDR